MRRHKTHTGLYVCLVRSVAVHLMGHAADGRRGARQIRRHRRHSQSQSVSCPAFHISSIHPSVCALLCVCVCVCVCVEQNRSRECELAITKSSRPLLMTRYFKMDPPFLYIVPSEDNFPLAPMNFSLSAKLVKYRRAECFAPHGQREREREGVSEFDIGGKRREVMADKEEGAGEGNEGKTLAEMQT